MIHRVPCSLGSADGQWVSQGARITPQRCALALPRQLIVGGLLSGLQLESIVYASMRHSIMLPSKELGGFLIGDGAGIGKGRQIAGLIFENFRRGRKKSVWFSASADLAADAARDFKDIGAAGVPICNMPDVSYSAAGTDYFGNGAMFCTYTCLTSGGRVKRIDMLIDWCGGAEFDGCLVFDECHKAKVRASHRIHVLVPLGYHGAWIIQLFAECDGQEPEQDGQARRRDPAPHAVSARRLCERDWCKRALAHGLHGPARALGPRDRLP